MFVVYTTLTFEGEIKERAADNFNQYAGSALMNFALKLVLTSCVGYFCFFEIT